MAMNVRARAAGFFVYPLVLITSSALSGSVATAAQPAPRPVAIAAAATAKPQAWLLHLPGISGPLRIDQSLVRGLTDGGLAAQARIYDWTCGDPGLNALLAYDRNQKEAQKIADAIVAHARAHPEWPIYLTGHSGGTGLAIWALEKLPDDVQVESVHLLAPALSPGYDLSKALRHVRGKAYVFFSPYDNAVLGAGTKLFGTIDRVRGDSAGLRGFAPPKDADAQQYRKLIAMPYDEAWLQYGNRGDHIGPMSRAFARQVLAPLLLGRAVAGPTASAATQPVSAAASGS